MADYTKPPTEADIEMAAAPGAQAVEEMLSSMTPQGMYSVASLSQFASELAKIFALVDPTDEGLKAIKFQKDMMPREIVERWVALTGIAQAAGLTLPEIATLDSETKLTQALMALDKLAADPAFAAKIEELKASNPTATASPAPAPTRTPKAQRPQKELDMLFGGAV